MEQDLLKPFDTFRQDVLNHKLYIHHEDGTETPTTFSKAKNMERAMVWVTDSLQTRLNEEYFGQDKLRKKHAAKDPKKLQKKI